MMYANQKQLTGTLLPSSVNCAQGLATNTNAYANTPTPDSADSLTQAHNGEMESILSTVMTSAGVDEPVQQRCHLARIEHDEPRQDSRTRFEGSDSEIEALTVPA